MITPGRQVGFLANSLANLLVGVATLGYAVIVPAVVARQFGIDLYGTWYLAFQVSTYVVLLDLGSQYVVTSEVATDPAGGRAARLTTAAVVFQATLAVVVVLAATSWAGLTGQATLARLVAVLGVGAVATLLASTVRAWFGGLHRAHVPAVWMIGARLAAVAGLTFGAVADLGLIGITIAVAAPAMGVHVALLAWSHRPPSPWARPDRAAFVELGRSSLPLAVWVVCGVVIGGVDIFVVRAVDPAELGRFAIALPLLAVPAGVVTATVTAWIPSVARAEALLPGGGRAPTLSGTTVAAAVLATGAIPFVAYADELVRLWAGPGPWDSAATYLRILYVASAIRFTFLPWATLVLVKGQQRSITPVPVVEAATNLVASVALGLWLGAVGVAVGTILGALVAAVIYLSWAIPRTASSAITSAEWAHAAAAAWPPVLAAVGVAVVAVVGVAGLAKAAAVLVALSVDAWWLFSQRGHAAAAARAAVG